MNNITAHDPMTGPKPEFTIPLHDGSEERISIIIVHRDRPEYLNICLQSIAVTSFNNNYEIIVVDNGSGQESIDFLDDLAENGIKVIKNDKNLYWSAAANKGVAAADKHSKYYVFMHCDVVILNPAWMDLLINVCESQSSGFVGIELQSYMMGSQKVEFIQEYLCLVTKECWSDVGPWDERLQQVGQSFLFTMKAQTKGHKPQIMKNPIAHHYKMFSLDISVYETMCEASLALLPKLVNDLKTQAV